MTWIILFLALGLALVFLEVFLPGMVCGILGAVCLIVGVARAFSEFGTGGGAATLMATLVAGAVLLYAGIKLLPASPFGKGLALDARIDGSAPPAGLDALAGADGQAATRLCPGGKALFHGRRYDVVTEGGMLPEGAPVRVVRVEGGRIVVREHKAAT